MNPVELILSKLPDAKKNSHGWSARCPAHEDHRPSLSIAEGNNGQALVYCHAGCTAQAIVEAVALKLPDLMTAKSRPTGKHRQAAVRAATDHKPVGTFASADKAIAHLERKHGQRSADWTYHNSEGEPVGFVIRWDRPDGSKDIRPVSRMADGKWAIKGMPEPRPLYRLPDLLELPEGARVYICEGEKAADAARAVGLNATTSSHGSKSAAKTDWSALSLCDVVFLPDNDDAGKGYVEDVIDIMGKLNLAPVMKMLFLPNLPEGGDMADFVVMRGGDTDAIKAEVEALADNAESITRTPDKLTQPTKLPIEPFQPFPVDALPDAVAPFVNASAKAIGCDPSFIALPLLVGFASAIGNSRRVQLKRSWTEPAILWGAIIGESGSTKSSALELAFRAVRDRQQKAMREHNEAMQDYEVARLHYERDLAAWKRSKADTDPPEALKAPTCERCWTDDATIEALAKLLQDNPRGLLVIRDELAGWLHFDRYNAKGKGAEVSKWLEMFGGRALVVDRKTSGTIYVPQAAVSIIGGIQPGILTRYIGQEHRDNGLLAWLLLTMPPRRAKIWTEADIDPMAKVGISSIFEALYDLKPALDADGESAPAIVQLTAEGKRDWIMFYNEHNAEAANLCSELAAAWSKLEGYAARFALVHHLIRQVSNETVVDGIDAVSIAAGVKLARWFAHEARRVYAMLAEDDESQQSRQLIELIERRDGSISTCELTRSGPRQYRGNPEAAGAALDVLAERGYGCWKYTQRKKVFTLKGSGPGPTSPPDGTKNGGSVSSSNGATINSHFNEGGLLPSVDDREAEEEPTPEDASAIGDDDWGVL